MDVYKTDPAVHVAAAPVELGDGHEGGGVKEDVARGDGGRVVDVPGNPRADHGGDLQAVVGAARCGGRVE